MIRFFQKRRTFDCAGAAKVLQSYLDGETDSATAEKVLGHLDNCGACDTEAKEFMRLKEAIARTQVPVDDVVLEKLKAFANGLTD